MLEFVLKVMKNKKKEYITLLIITSILSSFVFSALSLYDASNQIIENRLINNILPAFIAFISLFLIGYVINYFINNKKQEFSLLLLTGRKTKDLFVYVMLQYGTINLLAFIIGIFTGILINRFIQILMTSLNYSFVFNYSILNTLFIYFFFFLFTIIFSLMLCTYQFNILTMNLLDYLSKHRVQETKTIKYSTLLYTQKKRKPYISLLLMILLIIFMIYFTILIFTLEYDFIMLYHIVIVTGTIIIINKLTPVLYETFHNQLLKKPVLSQGLMAFSDFSTTMLTILILNVSIIPIISIITKTTYFSEYIQFITIPSFIMIVVMIGLCFILKYSFYKEKIKSYISTFHSMGYNKKQLKNIYLLKNILFILLGVLVPFIIFFIFMYQSYIASMMKIETIIILSLLYIFTYLSIVIYMVKSENQLIKEVKPYV